jgi:hypothetical protein
MQFEFILYSDLKDQVASSNCSSCDRRGRLFHPIARTLLHATKRAPIDLQEETVPCRCSLLIQIKQCTPLTSRHIRKKHSMSIHHRRRRIQLDSHTATLTGGLQRHELLPCTARRLKPSPTRRNTTQSKCNPERTFTSASRRRCTLHRTHDLAWAAA